MSPRTSCPSCNSAHVESFMEYSGHHVDYFHCLDCRHIWNIPKGGDGPVNHVTPLPEPRSLKADKQQESTSSSRGRSAP